MGGGVLKDGIIEQAGARVAGWTNNIGLAAATTTNADDSIKITGSDGNALSPANYGWVAVPGDTAGQVDVLSITADVTLDLTGAHWGFGTTGDLTDQQLVVYALNDGGTLKWGVGLMAGRELVTTADDETIQSSVTTKPKVLVNSALSGSAEILDIGWFRANFDDTGGAAEDLWTVQTGSGDINIGGNFPIIEVMWVFGPSGYGNVDTRVREYDTVGLDIGGSMTTATTANNGTIITINQRGYFSCTRAERNTSSGNASILLTRNSTALSSDPSAQSIANIVAIDNLTTTEGKAQFGATVLLEEGDLIRAEDTSADADTDVGNSFNIIMRKVG